MYCRRHKLEPSEQLIGQIVFHDDIPLEDWKAFLVLNKIQLRACSKCLKLVGLKIFPQKIYHPHQLN